MSSRLPSARKGKGFKKGIDQDEARRKREDNIIQLRQNKRDENLQKRRAGGAEAALGAGFGVEASTGFSSTGQSIAQKVLPPPPPPAPPPPPPATLNLPRMLRQRGLQIRLTLLLTFPSVSAAREPPCHGCWRPV